MSAKAEETIRNYIQKYADKHHLSFEEAKEHAMCKLAALYLKKEDK